MLLSICRPYSEYIYAHIQTCGRYISHTLTSFQFCLRDARCVSSYTLASRQSLYTRSLTHCDPTVVRRNIATPGYEYGNTPQTVNDRFMRRQHRWKKRHEAVVIHHVELTPRENSMNNGLQCEIRISFCASKHCTLVVSLTSRLQKPN